DGPADLLVEQDRARGAVDAEVRADPELADEARAAVRLECAVQVLGPGRGVGADDLAVAELELDAVHVDGLRRRADREPDPADGPRVAQAVADLTARHVALAVGVDPRAPGDAEREVGALGLDADV